MPSASQACALVRADSLAVGVAASLSRLGDVIRSVTNRSASAQSKNKFNVNDLSFRMMFGIGHSSSGPPMPSIAYTMSRAHEPPCCPIAYTVYYTRRHGARGSIPAVREGFRAVRRARNPAPSKTTSCPPPARAPPCCPPSCTASGEQQCPP